MDFKTKTLIGVQVFVGVTAVAGGAALAIAPDGHLLSASSSVLATTPFADFRVPGVLLAVFVGVGGLFTAALTWRNWHFAEAVSIVYAGGLLSFELVEYLLIGWQPLQAFEGILAIAMLALIVTQHRSADTLRRSRALHA